MKKVGLLTTAATLALMSLSSPVLAEEVDQPAMEVTETETANSIGPWLPDIPEKFKELLGFVWGGP